MFNFVDHQERRKRDLEQAAAQAAAKEQEEQQKQLQQAAAAFVASQEQAGAEMAATSISSSLPVPVPVSEDIPLKTGQATELLENLATASRAVSSDASQAPTVSSADVTNSGQDAR